MKKYNKEISPTGQEIFWYEENGFRYSFIADPSNSDYQAYLASQSAPTVKVDE